MSLDKTRKLVEWLEITQLNRQYNLDEVKELLSIAMTELADQKDKSFESLPGASVDAIIEDMKASGEWHRLDNQIASYKARFTGYHENET